MTLGAVSINFDTNRLKNMFPARGQRRLPEGGNDAHDRRSLDLPGITTAAFEDLGGRCAGRGSYYLDGVRA